MVSQVLHDWHLASGYDKLQQWQGTHCFRDPRQTRLQGQFRPWNQCSAITVNIADTPWLGARQVQIGTDSQHNQWAALTAITHNCTHLGLIKGHRTNLIACFIKPVCLCHKSSCFLFWSFKRLFTSRPMFKLARVHWMFYGIHCQHLWRCTLEVTRFLWPFI